MHCENENRLGSPRASVALATGTEASDALLLRLRSVLASDDYQPPVLPAVALELLELSRDSEVSFSKVTALVKTEPLIAAKVLRLAKSAFYSRGRPIQSLDEALSRLGLRTLGDLFLREALTTRVFRAPSFQEPMEALRIHSTAVAGLTRKIFQTKTLRDEYAYMCGLLHDVGIAAGLLIAADVGNGAPLPDYEDVRAAVEEVHTEASEILAKAWGLPDDVRGVLRHHHDLALDGAAQPLAAAVALADGLIAEAGAPAGTETPDTQIAFATHELSMYDAEVEPLREEAVRQVEFAKSSI